MTTTCIACNSTDYGMISLYRHPKQLDQMFEFVTGVTAFQGSFLCISCYDEVKNFSSFKSKCVELQANRCNGSNQTASTFLEVSATDVQVYESKIGNVDSTMELLHQECEGDEVPVLLVNTSKEGEDENLNEAVEEKEEKVVQTKSRKTRSPRASKIKSAASPPVVQNKKRTTRSSGPNKPTPLTNQAVILNLKPVESKVTTSAATTEEYVIHTVDSSSGDVVGELIPLEVNNETPGQDQESEMEVDYIELTDGGTKLYKCSRCEKVCKQKGQLRSHQRTHTKVKPYACEYCEKSFSENGNLKQHIRSIHLDLRPFMCEKCNGRFKTHYSHRVHVRSCVTFEKPYSCDECDKTFVSSGKLLLHKRKHTGERPYKCSVCFFAFYDSCTLKRHIQRRHKNVKTKADESNNKAIIETLD